MFTVFWHLRSVAVCDSLDDEFYPLINFFDLQVDETNGRLNLWRNDVNGEIVFRFQREDIYRKYIGNVRTVGLSSQHMRLAVSVPITAGKMRHWMALQVLNGSYNSEGQSAAIGWAGRLNADGPALRLSYCLDMGGHRFGMSTVWSQVDRRDQQTVIEQYPHSDTDHSMNQYFLDLLEPTVGREIRYDFQNDSRELEAGVLLRISNRIRLGGSVRLQRRKARVDSRYVNTGSRDDLRGVRVTDLFLRMGPERYMIAFERRLGDRWRFRMEAGYTTEHLHFQAVPRDVPQSPRGVPLDFEELAIGAGNRNGIDLKARGMWTTLDRFDLSLVMGWGRSTYRGRGEGTTPVLGFRLGVLPIAHRGEVDVSVTARSRGIGMQMHKQWRRGDLKAGALLGWTQVPVRTEADAYLSLGLFARPVRDLSPYRLVLYRFHATPSLRVLENIRLAYQATQHVILIAEAGTRKVEPPEQKVRGGLIHKLAVSYLF